MRLHAASLARLAELGAAQLGSTAATRPPPLDPDVWAVASAHADEQLQERGIAHGSLLTNSWIGPARTLAAPSGQLRLELDRRHHEHDGMISTTVDGWWSDDGVVLAIVDGAARDVIAAPHADALPFMLLGLTGNLADEPSSDHHLDTHLPEVAAAAHDAGRRHDTRELRGTGDPTRTNELVSWQRRWRLRASTRDQPQHDLVIVTTSAGHWVIEPAADPASKDAEVTGHGQRPPGTHDAVADSTDTRDQWRAICLDIVGLWDRLLELSGSPHRREPVPWHTIVRPELGLTLRAPIGWQAAADQPGGDVRLLAPEPGTTVTLRRRGGSSLLDEVVGVVTLIDTVLELGPMTVRYRLVHHLDEDGAPMCSVTWRQLDPWEHRSDGPLLGGVDQPPVPVEVMATARVQRWKTDRATLLRIAMNVVPT